jgi:Uncharacterized conserved protein (DUF2190)
VVANEGIPYYEPGNRISARATGAKVIGKRFVALAAKKDPGSRELESDPGGSGGNVRVKPAAADDAKCFGVSTYDAEDGDLTTVVRGGFVMPVTAGVALVFGDPVGPGANGKAVKPGAGARVWGLSLSDAAVDQDAIVALY